MDIRKRVAERIAAPELAELTTELAEAGEQYVELQGRIEDLEGSARVFDEMMKFRPVLTLGVLEQLAELTEVDPQYVDLIRRLMQAEGLTFEPSENDRLLAVYESRVLAGNDPVTERILTIWTDYGFGLKIEIEPVDEKAREVWTEFWTAPRNQPVLSERVIHELSQVVLVDGEIYFVAFTSEDDAQVTLRVILTDEIKEIIREKDDVVVPVFYRREWKDMGGNVQQKYYRDWRVDDDSDLLDDVKLDPQVPIAGADDDHDSVLVIHVAHRQRGIRSLRGWPLLTTGAAWARAYKEFLENRAAVARAVAAVVDKLIVKGGSKALDVMRSRFTAALDSLGRYGLSDVPEPGSTWMENEALTRSRMPLTTGAGDAQIDGGALLAQAGLPGGIPPHLLGRGEVVRMAVAECHDEQTEFLSDKGWLRFDEWEPGVQVAAYDRDERHMVFTQPAELKAYEFDGELIRIKSRAVDCLVTPNHRFWASKNRDKMMREIRACDLPCEFNLPAFAPLVNTCERRETFFVPGFSTTSKVGVVTNYPGHELVMDDWLAFLGWWTAEGSCCLKRNGTGHQVEITLSSESPDCAEMDSLLPRLPWSFSRSSTSNDKYAPRYRWRCTSKRLYNWLKENVGLGAGNKRVPGFIFGLPTEQRRIFLDALWRGDGHYNKESKLVVGVYGTISEQLADDVQRLVLLDGGNASKRLSYAAGYKKETKSRDFWIVRWALNESFNLRRRPGQDTSHVSREHYSGIVYCFRIPEYGMFITRRNGYPLISCNSMDDPIKRQFTRYQNFWSSVWNDVGNLVLSMQEKYQDAKYETKEVRVTTDALVNVLLADLVAVGTVTQAMLMAGLISADTAQAVATEILRMALHVLGVQDAGEILKSTEKEPETEERSIIDQVAKTIGENMGSGNVELNTALEWAIGEGVTAVMEQMNG